MQFRKILDGPKDYISSLSLLSGCSHVLYTAWDGEMSIYDYENESKLVELRHDTALLSLCPTDDGKIYVGSVNGEVLEADLESGRFNLVSDIAQLGISTMCSYKNDLVVGSWDGSIQLIDTRSNNLAFRTSPSEHKVLSLDCVGDRVVAACTKGVVKIYDLRDRTEPRIRESGLKFQTRDLKVMPNGQGFVQSSIDGRVAVEFFEDDDSSRFAFRCHRMNLQDSQFVFPVNSVCFKPNSLVLFTGGSDGKVCSWNLETRKKIDELPKFDESVIKLACNGSILAVATGDDSFKTLATIEKLDLQPGSIYVSKL
ncbi:LAMI_0B04148g1_1 [Lachancea mirantina]|uniref:LAMI_0B04148g1_1 n=1 Tax=Lachancea mirantina TaxID=1230905 RepID=A0A1G4IV59_9SACH|nr:LAMI_0B04148g1_1 [Lachancea mirantina]